MGRFNRRGQEQVFYAPTLADPAAPTVTELGAAATPLHPVLRSISGFNYTGEDLDVSDMGSTWGKTIPGGDTAADSSMTFYEGDDAADAEQDVETALAKGDEGYIVFCPMGAPTATEKARVWPVRIKSNNPDETAENAGATFTVGFSIPNPPVLDATIAAGA